MISDVLDVTPQMPVFPTISIITPSYNQGAFLAETIESVISQQGDFIIDYIIVDGGSSDNSVDIIRRYDSLLKTGLCRIGCRGITFRWISEKDHGQTSALMKGFRMVQGEILAWLNSDDTYLPGALQSAVDFFRAKPDAALVYGDACFTDVAGSVISNYRTAEFDLVKLASANIICQPAAFFRREAFEAVGCLDETLHFTMDYDLWIRLGKRFPCYHIQQMLATYRLHETSKTINSDTLISNSEESLDVTRRHFCWAPITRIYTSCSILCQARLPGILGQNRLFVTTAAIACAIILSIYLNRGFHRNDLKLLNRDNFRKLFKSRLEIMTGI